MPRAHAARAAGRADAAPADVPTEPASPIDPGHWDLRYAAATLAARRDRLPSPADAVAEPASVSAAVDAAAAAAAGVRPDPAAVVRPREPGDVRQSGPVDAWSPVPAAAQPRVAADGEAVAATADTRAAAAWPAGTGSASTRRVRPPVEQERVSAAVSRRAPASSRATAQARRPRQPALLRLRPSRVRAPRVGPAVPRPRQMRWAPPRLVSQVLLLPRTRLLVRPRQRTPPRWRQPILTRLRQRSDAIRFPSGRSRSRRASPTRQPHPARAPVRASPLGTSPGGRS